METLTTALATGKRAAVLAGILSLLLAPAAIANTHHKTRKAHHKTHHRHHRHTPHPTTHSGSPASPGHGGTSGGGGGQAASSGGVPFLTAPPGVGSMSLAPPSTIGVANAPGCNAGADPTPTLRQYGARLLRVVISPLNGGSGDNGQALPCVRAAAAAGFQVMISIQWWSIWTQDETIAYFARQLETYGPYAYAIGVGNEQDLDAVTPEDYSQVWRAVQPLIAAYAPGAVRVAGEISPWGLSWLQQAWLDGLPAAQALAFHPYTTVPSSPDPYTVAAWAYLVGLPTWATEGLDAPGAWSSQQVSPRPLGDFVGVSVAFAWLG